MEEDEDLQAIGQIRAGQIQAYGFLVRKYQTRIRGYCRGVCGNATEAEDVAQEIFIKAYKGLAPRDLFRPAHNKSKLGGLGGFRGTARFSTWLYRIAVNHCRDFLRYAVRNRMESWETLREREGESAEMRIADFSDSQLLREQGQQVREALDRLPEQVKTILILREVQGLSYQELTKVLNCSVDAVKARLRRARQELGSRLKEKV